MFNKYYQDELAYLRDLGREFAERNPESAGYLAEPGSDPDVERLLEGFSFLTARIREKLDDELPELTHSLLELFWPHYLRPLPSLTVAQFTLKPKAVGKLGVVPRGAELASGPIDGTPCRFRTAYETVVAPLEVSDLEVGTSGAPFLLLGLKVLKGANLPKLELKSLRLHLHGTAAATRALYLSLARYLKSIKARDEKGNEVALPKARIVAVGFEEEEALLPQPPNSFPGYRLLQEYFLFPTKFMFLDVVGLEDLAKLGPVTSFELNFELDHLPSDIPPVNANNVQLNCSPVVNLFRHDADPIRLDRARVEYPVRPSGPRAHYEIYSVEKVKGLRRGDPEPRHYQPFLRTFRVDGEDPLLFKTRLTPALTTEGTDLYMSFLEGGQLTSYADETISTELTCTNRGLPTALAPGDLSQATPTSPAFATFRNLTAPTPPVPPPLEGDLFWSLLSHMSLNYLSLLRPEALRELLRLYDFRARVDRQAERALGRRLEGILNLHRRPAVRLLQGAAVRGVEVSLELDEEKFGGEGEAYLFGGVLERFLAHYVTLNAYSQLSLHGKKYGEVHSWPPRSGARCIL